MRILYGVQGTGNGHLSRATSLLPELRKFAQVDVLISGNTPGRDLTGIQPDYVFTGYGFIFGKNGGIDWKATSNSFSFRQLIKEIRQLDLSSYDLVINDFEPISAWAGKIQRKEVINLSHQVSLLSKSVPGQDHMNWFKRIFLQYYAPYSRSYGFHFRPYTSNIGFPVIKPSIQALRPFDDGHYIIYLPAFEATKILPITAQFPDQEWIVFDKHNRKKYRRGNTLILPCDHDRFYRYLESASGVICGAGFELPSEVLYLKKKLMVVPMKGQFEQHMNAAALKEIGIIATKHWNSSAIPIIADWLANTNTISIPIEDNLSNIKDLIQESFYSDNQITPKSELVY